MQQKSTNKQRHTAQQTLHRAQQTQHKAQQAQHRVQQTQQRVVTDMADNAIKNYEQTIRTGFKLQEEAVKAWSNLFNQTGAAQEYQKGFAAVTQIANKVLPLAARRMEEVLQLVEKNTRTGTELMRKAAEVAQSPILSNGQNKWTELWTSSMSAMRSNTEALLEINAKAVDSWMDLIKKSAEQTESRAARA